MSVADTIADKLLDRSVDLARLEAGERRKVMGMLLAMEKEIIARLKAIDPTAPKLSRYQRDRLNKLLIEVQAIIRSTYRRINSDQQRVMTGVSVAEAPVVAEVVNTAAGGRLVSAGLGQARLHALANDLLILGAPLKEHWGRQAAAVVVRFQDMMRRGLMLGEGLSRLIQQTRKIVQTSQLHAETLVRTSILSTQNATRMSVFEANADILEAATWVTTLDTRACHICIGLSGRKWDIRTKKPIGHTIPWPGVIAHASCRCTQVATPQAFGDISKDLSFEEWFAGKPAAQQQAILGRGRFALWHSGRIHLSQLVSQDHRPLTLKELERVA